MAFLFTTASIRDTIIAMKTDLTNKIEKALWLDTVNRSTFGCLEVTIGFPSTRHLMGAEEERVDYMTYKTDGVFRCYEIKVSAGDLKSKAKLSFFGHYNYLVLPKELYETEKDKTYFKNKFSKWSGLGIIVYDRGYLIVERKPSRKTVSYGQQGLLLESFTRSLARDVNKFYKSTL